MAALVLTVLLGVADALTGFEISFAFFYLVPVSLAAWVAGRRPGVLLSAICAIVWLAANHLAGQSFSLTGVAYWNAATRFGFFVVAAVLLAEFRRLLAVERQLARSDPLTGLLNRRAFLEIVQAECERTRRFSHPLTLLYLDLDDFKAFNDTLGHPAGDRLLKLVADTITGIVRSVDSVARLGGDEFGVLLPETDQSAARALGERLQNVFRSSVRFDSRVITVSIGAVSCQAAPPSVEALVAAADSLMYRVKHSTKNDVQYSEYSG